MLLDVRHGRVCPGCWSYDEPIRIAQGGRPPGGGPRALRDRFRPPSRPDPRPSSRRRSSAARSGSRRRPDDLRRCVRRRTRRRPAPGAARAARPRPAGRPRAGAGRRSARGRSSSRRPRNRVPPSAPTVRYTASIRPRITRPASASWNGASTRYGVRWAYGVRRKASLRVSRSRSSAISAPGSGSAGQLVQPDAAAAPRSGTPPRRGTGCPGGRRAAGGAASGGPAPGRTRPGRRPAAAAATRSATAAGARRGRLRWAGAAPRSARPGRGPRTGQPGLLRRQVLVLPARLGRPAATAPCRAALGGGGAARRVERERPDVVLGGLQRGVVRVAVRFVRPVLDLAVPRLAVLVQPDQEVRGAARLLLARPPPVGGAEQQRPRPGERDVAEPQFLGRWWSRMAAWKVSRPFCVHSATSGRVAASPRSACGRTLACQGHSSRTLALGKASRTSPGTTTTSHSRPLDLCAVSTLTVFSPPGSELSRPFSYWAAVRRKARKASRVASPSSDGEARRDVEERAQRLAAAGGQRVRGRGELDLQAGHGQHPVQHVHQRVGQRAAQVA